MAEVEPKFYEGKPRVRYEWRKLSDEHRKMFGEAFRVMVETPTQSGREEFGPLFWNYQDLVAFHVCSVVDPVAIKDVSTTSSTTSALHCLLILIELTSLPLFSPPFFRLWPKLHHFPHCLHASN